MIGSYFGAFGIRGLVEGHCTGWIEVDSNFYWTAWSGLVRSGIIKQACYFVM